MIIDLLILIWFFIAFLPASIYFGAGMVIVQIALFTATIVAVIIAERD
jgi:hypothetical protein